MTHNVIISIGYIYKSLKSIPLIPTYNGLRDYTHVCDVMMFV